MTTTVICRAADKAGNIGSETFHITVTPLPGADTTPPVLTLPSDITTQATDTQGTTVFYSASATDNVDGPVTVTCDKPD